QKMYGNDLSGADNAPQAALDYIVDPGNFSDFNWQEAIYRPAFMQAHDLSVSGGGPSGTYRISLGNVSQNGIALHTKYNRTNVRANSEFNVSNFIKIGQTFSYARSLFKREPNAYGRGLFYHAIRMYPYFQPKDQNGNWQESDDYWGGGTERSVESGIRNPLAFINKLWDAAEVGNDLAMSGYAEITILRGLTYKINGAYAQIDRSEWEKYSAKGEEFSDYYYSDDNSYSRSKNKSYNWNIDNLLRFQRKIGKHNLDVTVGYVAQKWYSDELGGYKWNFTSDQTSSLDAPGGMDPDTWSSSTEHALLSYLGQAFYSYDDRYLVTVNFRRDGSSRFHTGYRWGNFPGVSLGWRLSNEKFWEKSGLVNAITDFKIRAGYGILGRQNLGDYDYIATLENEYAVFDNDPRLSLITGNPVSYDTKWEELVSKTVGIDYELFNGKVNGSFDYYNNETRGMIIGVPISPSVGGGVRQGNLGEITNKGFEMTINYKNKIGDFSYNVGFNLSTQKTILVNFGSDLSTQEDELGGDASNLPEWDVEHITELHKGRGLSEFWLIKTNGLFKNDEEAQQYLNKNGEMIQPFAKAGDIKFIDYNGDGQITAEGDRQFCGTGIPKVYAGFNFTASYKQIDLYIGATGAFGQVIYNTTRYLTEQNHGFGNFSTALLDAFDPVSNPNSNIPRLNPDDIGENGNTRAATDRYIEKGNYVKIRNIELGYTLPEKIEKRIKMSSARIFARVQNLANITRYTGPDPEIGGTPTNWQAHPSLYTAGIPRDFTPQARSYQFGVNVTF
ncbi:MAG TPA: SusC/RagA family TonB-linked outer membrane protein, partial [Flavitalea sp.]|nr:SusC/RagA family TonB-linked outer membrane protein [Flavitalea sp.]